MANYIDAVVTPVPKKNLEKYKKLSKLACKVWLDHGALEYYECEGDDVPKGEVTSFPKSVNLKPSEVVYINWIVYKSRKHRDSVMKKVMSDERMAFMNEEMPFDGTRMIFGGFKPVISSKAKK